MIEKTDILKMAKHVLKRVSGGRDHKIMHPYREWGIGVLVSLMLAVVGGMFAVDRYLIYENTSIEIDELPEDVVTYREN